MSYNDTSIPSSSNSHNSIALLEPVENQQCQVCGQQSHGNHFGANTCRACAAFFRRTIYLQIEQKCRSLIGNCVPNNNGRWSCKKCRLDRCLSLNMIPDNIQRDRDVFSTTEKVVPSRKRKISEELPVLDVEVFTKKLQFIHFVARVRRSTEYSWVDLSSLIQNARQQLMEIPVNDRMENMNSLEKLTLGLNEIQKLQKVEITETTKIGQLESCCLWENEVSNMAKWLTYCDEFRTLDCDQRLDILKCIWHVWNRVERVAMTARMRTKQLCGDTQFVISNDEFVDYNNLKLEVGWLTNYNKQQLSYYLHPVSNGFNEFLVSSFIELDPTDIELTYILCHLCLHYTAKKLGAEIQAATEILQETLANNLHEYYVKKDKFSSKYSYRLKKLLDISYQYQKELSYRQKRFEVGAVFDVFKINFSHPEMFSLSC